MTFYPIKRPAGFGTKVNMCSTPPSRQLVQLPPPSYPSPKWLPTTLEDLGLAQSVDALLRSPSTQSQASVISSSSPQMNSSLPSRPSPVPSRSTASTYDPFQDSSPEMVWSARRAL